MNQVGSEAPEPQPPSASEKRAALDLVLNSTTFARADQLRSFLRFIGEMELEGKGADITEHLIAVKALGRRSEDFFPSEDSSVRVQALILRKKLEEFYSHEKSDGELRIEISKGCYQPRFVRTDRETPSPGETEPALRPLPSSKPKAGWLSSSLLAFTAGAMVAAVAIVLAVRYTSVVTPRIDPVVREAWGPIGQRNANVLIAIGNPLYMIYHPFPVSLPTTVKEYPAPPGMDVYYRKYRPLPQDAGLTLHNANNAMNMGLVLGVVDATRLLNSLGASYQILPERIAPLPSFRGRNVLLLGSPEDSIAVTALQEHMPFTIDFDSTLREMVVHDHLRGKEYVPRRDSLGHYTQVYGLITVIPSEGVLDGSRRTVVFSGITSVGCHAAVDFFASPQSLQSFLQRLRAEGRSSFPGAYQIMIRATTTADTLLVSADYEAHAVLFEPGSK